MSLFDRLDAMVSRTVDAINATDFVLTPMKARPNGRPSPDPDRQVLEGVGVFDYVDADVSVELGNRTYSGSNDLRSMVGGAEPVLSVDRSIFPTTAQEPKQGDLIEFPGADLPRFEVVSCRRDGLAHIVLRLVEGGG